MYVKPAADLDASPRLVTNQSHFKAACTEIPVTMTTWATQHHGALENPTEAMEVVQAFNLACANNTALIEPLLNDKGIKLQHTHSLLLKCCTLRILCKHLTPGSIILHFREDMLMDSSVKSHPIKCCYPEPQHTAQKDQNQQ